MKFGKRLKIHLEETLPEWRDKFVAYKQLKKRLKLLRSAPDCFTEVAFLPATESADSYVGRVDSMLRNGTEIGHYGNRLQLGSFPAVLENQDGRRTRGSVGRTCEGGLARGEVEGGEEEVRSRGLQGNQVQQGVEFETRKRKARESSDNSDGEIDGPFESDHSSSDQMEFIKLLNVELDKFNSFFIDKEEDYVMRLQDLKVAAARMKERTAQRPHLSEEDLEEMTKIFTRMITFHGEMVLLETYSSLNYTGLVKILKKHDKWTGGVLRMSFIQTVLHQPFFTTELLSQLVKDCEVNLSSLFPLPAVGPTVEARSVDQPAENSSGANASSDSEIVLQGAGSPAQGDGANTVFATDDAEGVPHRDNLDSVYRSCEAALETISVIRRGSSTYSILSMPPLDPDGDESLGVVINEQSSRDSPTPCRGVSVSQE